MENNVWKRIAVIAALIIIAACMLGVLALVFYPLFVGERPEFYVRLFLLIMIIGTFAQMRMYNAIVQNTRFMIKLRDALMKLEQTVPVLDRASRSLQQTMNSLKGSAEGNAKTCEGAIKELIESLEKNAQKIKL